MSFIEIENALKAIRVYESSVQTIADRVQNYGNALGQNCMNWPSNSSYSLDVGLIGFFLFLDLKRMLGGKKFVDNGEVIAE